ncbi:MAG: hypothetical protein LBJ88_01200 [Campylobacteraceae bacterium]|jgi:hypothetical protein|nr:hypothetical protein [Campylobacteraceae bacterium]
MDMSGLIRQIKKLEAEPDMDKLGKNYVEIKEKLLSYPQEIWSYDMTMAYARTLNFLQDYSSHNSPYEEAYDLLLTVKEMGSSDYEWNQAMASISFNLQLYTEAMEYAKRANDLFDGCADEMLELYSKFI